MMRLGPGQLGSTHLSVENCLQQMHFITQLHLFLELALHIYESGGPVLPSCSDHPYVIPMLSLSAWGFSGSPRPGLLLVPLPLEAIGTLFGRYP